MAVAPTTLTSERRWARPFLTRDVPKKWFGLDVPEHVTVIELRHNHLTDELEAWWRVKGTTEIHTMPFKQTDEGVMAVLTAMKLTC